MTVVFHGLISGLIVSVFLVLSLLYSPLFLIGALISFILCFLDFNKRINDLP